MQELGNCKQVTLCHEWGSADVGILEDKTGFRISVFFLFVCFWQGTAFESSRFNLGFVRAVGEKVTKQPC